MGDRREDDMSAIAWPGFVDILSATVIMFVFFVMIVATVLFFHIIIFKSQTKAYYERAIQAVSQQSEAQIKQIQTEFAESQEQKVEFNSEEMSLIVFFGKDSISVNEVSLKLIKAFFEKHQLENRKKTITFKIVASKSPQTLEPVARKIALARMLNVRNVVIDYGFPASSADPKIIPGQEVQGSYDWVRIVIEDSK